ncbi:Methyltransferase-like_protein [Hexamita inflata]|uniref:Methyltransferase-like protein n=1 Tax=Hexamita inflata TaxID=28002 RepID=A0AA86U2X3_9EUKA|nr:Methyltransferase-like protein [Hexamita inflata]
MSDKWDSFYLAHKTGMYQDRHWLWQIFPEIFPLPPDKSYDECYCEKSCCQHCGILPLSQLPCAHTPKYSSLFSKDGLQSFRHVETPFPPRDYSHQCVEVLEVGCGVGNTSFPLLEKNAEISLTCGDFSQAAVDIFKQRPRFNSEFINCSVIDATSFQTERKFDFVVLMFVLSALNEQQIIIALQNCVQCLKTGGTLLIFDYAAGDYREEKRLKRGETGTCTAFGRLLERQNELTQALYFNQGFKEYIEREYETKEYKIHTKQETNRKTGEQWVKQYVLAKIGKTE